jgi:pimeloyl-ACP methyl ester carboxylesterase
MLTETPLGAVEHVDTGDGDPVLFVHGTPGGSDQGALMGQFLVHSGFRVVAVSRPGYLGTPLTDALSTPDQQADLELALMDSLGIDQFGLVCWSGGGPSSYRLAVKHPDRVRSLVTLAAVSKAYEFASGIKSLEYSLLTGGLGNWLMKEMVRHAPKQVVKMSAAEEADLTKEQARELSEHIWDNEEKREFVLALSGTVSGRKAGLKNDQVQFPLIGDLELGKIQAPTLLVHGTADTDVRPDQSDHAAELIPNATIDRVPDGTHVCTWTDPSSDAIQRSIIEHLRT